MKFTITQKKENKLLGRVELKGTLDFEKVTPSNHDVTNAIVKELTVKADTVVVKSIYTAFGTRHAEFAAYVYDSVEKKNHIEKSTKHSRKLEAERKKKEEEEKKAAEEAKKKAEEEAAAAKEAEKAAQETPAEETKEEAPAENKEE